ncbi:MAG TPA: 3-isopropylmalate dehydratase large subunit [Candidatus Omnitrophica bacterium]|nr:3-isopropylmalate dehydratase large subunit [Candidatus Omnitrophota bacterium]
MGLTLIEKILIKHSLSKKLEDFIYAKVDFCFGNDITAPLAVKKFLEAKFEKIFDNKKIGFICDHFLPARDFKSANNAKLLKEFAKKFKIKNCFDINNCGIEHVFLVEKGLIKPYQLIVGADSHTCTLGALGCAAFGVGSTDLAAVMREGKIWLRVPPTIKFIYKGKLKKWVRGKDLILYTIGKIGVDGALYKVMEFSGEVIKKLNMEDRFTMTNMAVEAGAKTAIIEPDEVAWHYLRKTVNYRIQNTELKSDKDAKYEKIIEIDVSKIESQVACPHLPANVEPVKNLKKVKLTQVFIGSCTNGRISDLRLAAKILRERKVKKGLRVIIIPATPKIYKQAEKEGLIKVFLEAGCIICPSSCGPCLGGHSGILDKGEVALATSNRNFIGRMGHPDSFVYLSNAGVAAASAIKGRIAHPQEVER